MASLLNVIYFSILFHNMMAIFYIKQIQHSISFLQYFVLIDSA
jgi:hypothetical protein